MSWMPIHLLIALCASSNPEEIMLILSVWTRLPGIHLPQDLIEILISFTRTFTVYSTRNQATSGHPRDDFKSKHDSIIQ